MEGLSSEGRRSCYRPFCPFSEQISAERSPWLKMRSVREERHKGELLEPVQVENTRTEQRRGGVRVGGDEDALETHSGSSQERS